MRLTYLNLTLKMVYANGANACKEMHPFLVNWGCTCGTDFGTGTGRNVMSVGKDEWTNLTWNGKREIQLVGGG